MKFNKCTIFLLGILGVVDQALAQQKIINLQTESEKIVCSQGVTRQLTQKEKDLEKEHNIKIECGFYSCSGDKGNEFIFLDFPHNKIPVLAKKRPNSLDLVDEWEMKIGDREEIKKKQKNSTVFSYYSMMISQEEESSLCSGSVASIIRDQIRIKKEALLSLLTADLVEVLSNVNGELKKNIYTRDQLFSGGCFYEQIYIDPNLKNSIQALYSDGPKYKRIVTRPLTIQEVENIFKKESARKDMPWNWSDGCYARAHVVTNELAEEGVEVDKIWATSNIDNPNTKNEWNFHVAPLVYIQENGHIVRYVIDPAVANRPVTDIEWLNIIRNKNSSGLVEIDFPIPHNSYVPSGMTVFAIAPREFYSNSIPLDRPLSNLENVNVSKKILSDAIEDLKAGRRPGVLRPGGFGPIGTP